MATVEEITARLKSAVANGPGLDQPLKIDLQGEGVILITGNQVTNDDSPAACTITVAREDLEAMAGGSLDPTMAFMQGKLKIDGDMALAMKLQPLLAAARG